jgi:sugar phosphate isomerase/epimerase
MRLGLEAGEYTRDVAVEHGIRGVPISADQLANDGVDATLTPLKERGLEVCQIGAFMFNPLSTDLQAQAKQAATLTKAIPLARETGCPYIVINGGNYHPSGYGAGDARNFTDEALTEVADALKPYLEAAEKHGAKLSIEAYLKTAVHSAETFLKLKEKVGGADTLRCNVDVTSLYDYQDLWDPTGKVEHVCTALAGHYGLGHIKEVALHEGFHIHAGLAPLGSGRTNWAQVLRLMAPHLPEDSWLILEHVLSPEEGRASIKLLRAAADEAGVTLG